MVIRIDTLMQMMVHTACSEDKSFSVTRNGRTMTCTFHSLIDGEKPKGVDGFLFSINARTITELEATRFIQEKDK